MASNYYKAIGDDAQSELSNKQYDAQLDVITKHLSLPYTDYKGISEVTNAGTFGTVIPVAGFAPPTGTYQYYTYISGEQNIVLKTDINADNIDYSIYKAAMELGYAVGEPVSKIYLDTMAEAETVLPYDYNWWEEREV